MKIVIAGEAFEWDGTKAPMSEALAVEQVYQRRYAEWQTDLSAGSAKALCVLAWIIWRRDGRKVPFEDIMAGKVDFDLMEMLTSMAESAEAEQPEAEPDPTPLPDPAGISGTGTGTSSSSPGSSGSARGRSSASTSRTSKR